MRQTTTWMHRHQVACYLAAIAVGAVVGLAAPAVSEPAQSAVLPALALLLYVTFLGVPIARLGDAIRDRRFLSSAVALNFVVVPIVVFALSRIVAHNDAILVGVLLVLLAPCVDYVIAFTRLAGGATDRLLAATPLLMLLQMLLLPVYLWLFVGSAIVQRIDPSAFVMPFVGIIAVPLAAAWITQVIAHRRRKQHALDAAVDAVMVVLMALTLAVVVGSQISGVRHELASLALPIVVFALFAVVMVAVGVGTSGAARLDTEGRRAIVFSGVTRNSLVVLPLALALPAGFELAPLVVASQTLVELVAMVVLVRLVPRLVR